MIFDKNKEKSIKMKYVARPAEVGNMSRIARKPVLRVYPKVRHKHGCTVATDDGQRIEISHLGSRGIVLAIFVAKLTKLLISYVITMQLMCTFVFAQGKSRF